MVEREKTEAFFKVVAPLQHRITDDIIRPAEAEGYHEKNKQKSAIKMATLRNAWRRRKEGFEVVREKVAPGSLPLGQFLMSTGDSIEAGGFVPYASRKRYQLCMPGL
ncbi:hypothetical protein CIHG_06487 [Coccidioides immitis H538.4]|uniref:Uncharacterized protein n=3 Tax=Coccidioides immitis TaxID=5501 RepID=A0A0J8QZD1_COCIT|nr:hypothetical protein CIRG_10299 [Coccidioides immitis RMSCC 2394]KMU76743.1 hypothetical protein CISG_05886 [Coccidioides immitis RMSCC 3703]KMU88820.1 hypothetical protein CIHG_06487 [Coccidioides immitis H538.4]